MTPDRVLPEGTRVQIEGNGEGTVKYNFTKYGRPLMYHIRTDDGNTVEVTHDKVVAIPTPEGIPPRVKQGEIHAGLVGPPPDLMKRAQERTSMPTIAQQLAKARENFEAAGVTAKEAEAEMRRVRSDAEDRHIGVVRAPSNPKEGDWVCFCRWGSSAPDEIKTVYQRGKVMQVNPDQISPLVIRTEGQYVYANSKQVHVVDPNAYCPYDVREAWSGSGLGAEPWAEVEWTIPIDESNRKAVETMAGLPTGDEYYWGFKTGEDVSVRGWGAGKIKTVWTAADPNTDRGRKPIDVELANGKVIHAALQDLSKIKYGSVLPPSATAERLKSLDDKLAELDEKTQHIIEEVHKISIWMARRPITNVAHNPVTEPLSKDDINIEPITDELRPSGMTEMIARLRGMVDDRLKGIESKIDKLANRIELIERPASARMSRIEKTNEYTMEILRVFEGKLGGPWLLDDETTIPGRIAELDDQVRKTQSLIAGLISQLSGDGK